MGRIHSDSDMAFLSPEDGLSFSLTVTKWPGALLYAATAASLVITVAMYGADVEPASLSRSRKQCFVRVSRMAARFLDEPREADARL